jgi:DNA-binding winged helix-turn-helix (wHTH) protein
MSLHSQLRVVRFGLFELDVKTGELRKRGGKVRLQEQPFQVLAMLVARPGELVTREELRQKLWADAVFVDFDHGLNKAVGKIRRALGDLAESPRFVETLERRGYRFIAPVENIPDAGTSAAASAVPAHLARLVWGDRTVALGEGTHLIGRDPAAAIWLDSATVSRCHATLVVDGPAVTLHDLGSHNGTFVNDERVHGTRVLAHGDEVRVGPARLILHSAPASRATLTDADG